jgi:nucleoside 2-deoxyribosyltransferase
MIKMKVFFVGKVSEYDWRSEIVNWQETTQIDPEYEFMGPYYQYIGEGEDAKRSYIFNENIDKIGESDVIFAYIDTPDAYGALFELGCAYTKRIPIYIYFKRGIDYRDFWFASFPAQQVFIANDHLEAWDLFKDRLYFHKYQKIKKISYKGE